MVDSVISRRVIFRETRGAIGLFDFRRGKIDRITNVYGITGYNARTRRA
jgi:hypothetical protein